MGILSGLEKFGFKSVEKVNLYEDESANKDKKKEAANQKKEISESEMLYDKTYECPICQTELKVRTLRVGKAKLLNSDLDLRATYQGIDPLKYDAIICKSCGYAALSRYFNADLTDTQMNMIKTAISAKYKPASTQYQETYTYDEAIENHKMALLNAVVKKAKASEKAYICLKLAWLLRGKAEHYPKTEQDFEAVTTNCKKEELQYLLEAKTGFVDALAHESGSICGMEPITVEYLCAALTYETGDYEESLRMVSRIIANPSASSRMKDKARELKEELSKGRK